MRHQDGLASEPSQRSPECEDSAIECLSSIADGSLMTRRVPVCVIGILRGLGLWIGVAFFVVAATTFASEGGTELANSFAQQVKPFLDQHCLRCHNPENLMSGIRVDHLDAGLDDRQLKLWEAIERQLSSQAMPPEDESQPTANERQMVAQWIRQALTIARSRPAPKNGGVRRLTVAQYRNTLRELLLLEDDLGEILPADAVSRDGFVNNEETLVLSPPLLDAYFEIAEKALDRCIVDPKAKPKIQNFRVDLGERINPEPFPDQLVLGADSHLLQNEDFVVTQLTPKKSFAFEPFIMKARHRFIEGYQGNDTVRDWRDFDSIYHSVFACMRGAHGYPKGEPYSLHPNGMLLRPAIPSEEVFGVSSTYGPHANFKVSLRELPDQGRFRVTVTAAKDRDGLLLDPGSKEHPPESPGAIVVDHPISPQVVNLPQAGIYQVDLYPAGFEIASIAPDDSRLSEGLIGAWALDGDASSMSTGEHLWGRLQGDAAFVDSPFGKSVSLDGQGDAIVVPQHVDLRVAEGDFTVAAWIHPRELRQAGIVCLGKYGWIHGWYLDMPDNTGVLRIETAGPNNRANGTVSSPANSIQNNAWQHVAAVVRRGEGETQLFINGYRVATGTVGKADLGNPAVDLNIGRIQDANEFVGEIDDVRIYRRALNENEIHALVVPGRQFATMPPRQVSQAVSLALGNRQFSATWRQPAFLAVRLEAGKHSIAARQIGTLPLGRIVLTPLSRDHDVAIRFAAFEQRSPRIGVHLGLRRDCGSTLARVGPVQTVSDSTLSQYVFEGAIHNFPNPDVEANNVNYLAGIREIGVRSEYTDGRDMPRLLIRSVEFEGPFFDSWPPDAHRNIFGDADEIQDLTAESRRIIQQFASRAFRRPVSPSEEASLISVFQTAFSAGATFHEAMKDALLVVLTSPQFLFLVETSASPEPEPLDDYELASKLAYFLWNGPPDQATLKLAAKGMLRGSLDSEVKRLIEDHRFERFVEEFTSQWLDLDKFAVLEPDLERFPKLTRDVRSQLHREPLQFVQHLIRHDLPTRNLIMSDFVVANEVVASFYGLADKPDSGFQFVAIPHRRADLGGVLTQPAIMAGLSDGRESNPVKRGAWLARKIVAEPPDDPPPNVPTLSQDLRLSLRERLEQHRNQPGCAQCHSKIDPWGIPFEEFDAGGAFKLQANDARSSLPDGTLVSGVNDLQRYLTDDRIDQVAFSVLKHLATYACGRSLSYHELEVLKADCLKLRGNGYRMQEMLRSIVESPMFLEK